MKDHPSFPRLFLFASLLIAALSWMVAPAWAEELDDDRIVLAEAALPEDTMDETRGGFIDSSGMIYSFAVDVRTQIDGAITLTRQITLTAGQGGQLAAASNVDLTNNSGALATLIGNGQGLSVTSNSGVTTVLNQTASGTLASIVMNTANNRQIVQTIDLNLVLKNVPSLAMANLGNTISGLAQGAHLQSVGLGH